MPQYERYKVRGGAHDSCKLGGIYRSLQHAVAGARQRASERGVTRSVFYDHGDGTYHHRRALVGDRDRPLIALFVHPDGRTEEP